MSVLIYSNSTDKTSDYIENKLRQHKVTVYRIDTDKIVGNVKFSYRKNAIKMKNRKISLQPDQIGHVYLRRPEPLTVGTQIGTSQVRKFIARETSVVLEAFLGMIPEKKWINYPSKSAIASNKILQLTAASDAKLFVPPTLVTQNTLDLKRFFREHREQVIAKPLFAGYIEGSAKEHDISIYTSLVTRAHIGNKKTISICPTLFQKRIDKICDVRITFLDGMMTAVSLTRRVNGSQILDIRADNMVGVSYCEIKIPVKIRGALKSVLKGMGLRFGAIDFCIDKAGNWYFLEINPSGQWAWMDLVGGMKLYTLFTKALGENIK